MVVDEKDLPFPLELPVDGFPDGEFVIGADIGLDGPPVLWGSLDGAQVPNARKRHVQRTRDGSGREGQYIH